MHEKCTNTETSIYNTIRICYSTMQTQTQTDFSLFVHYKVVTFLLVFAFKKHFSRYNSTDAFLYSHALNFIYFKHQSHNALCIQNAMREFVMRQLTTTSVNM